MEKRKEDQTIASSFSFATLARAKATKLYLKGIVTKDILTNFSQFNHF